MYTFSPYEPGTLHGSLKLTQQDGENTNFGPDIDNLTVDACHETDTRVRVKIGAANRWSVPQTVLPRQEVCTGRHQPQSSEGNKVHIDEQPFAFEVYADSVTQPLFSTKGHDFIFCDQYIELTSFLPKHPYIYGLGEVNSSFRRIVSDNDEEFEPGTVTTLWTRDAAVPRHENLYSCHPFYMEIRDGRAHGVLLLNSNGMDIFLAQGKITYKILGGNIEMYFFTGPSPLDVLRQYTDFIGKPFMPPLWSLGVHQCRWGYDKVKVAMDVVKAHKDNNLPLDALWLDIDYMDRYQMFTHSPGRFPEKQFKELIDTLHNNQQHLVIILDPGVNAEDGNTAYEEGKRQGIFIKIKRGDKIRSFIGRVWPGKTCFPDWFHPDTQKYWTNQLHLWCKKFPVDGLWIDMNEISNFADGDCAELPNEEAAAMIPVGDQSVADMVEATSKEQKIHREVKQILNAEVSSESKDGVKVLLDDHEMSVDKNAIILSKREPQPPFSVSNPPYLINNAGTFEPLHTRTSPPDAFHYDGHMEYNAHNLYGHMECQATYQSLKEIYGDRTKPFILTRSSFVGTGRYAAKWLGDNASTYEDMEESIAGMLAMTMFGIPMVGADVGGFNKHSNEQLMLRWTQLATFYPFMRNHNGLHNRGQEYYRWSSVADLARRCFALRFSLLPYWYTLFYEAATMSKPVLHALSWLYPHDQETLTNANQFLLGDKLLISPVLKEGQDTVQAYFPADIWYDMHTGAILESNGWQELSCGLHDFVPVHVRGGSIVPMWDSPANTVAATKRNSKLQLWIGLDSTGRATGLCYLDNDEQLPSSSSVFAQFAFANGRFHITKLEQIGHSEIIDISRIIIAGIDTPSEVEFIRHGKRKTVTALREQDKVIIELYSEVSEGDGFTISTL